MAGASAGAAATASSNGKGAVSRQRRARREMRLHRVRQRQGGPSLSQALALGGAKEPQKNGADREKVLADTLTSILYAAYLGDPEGPALSARQRRAAARARHLAPPRMRAAWRLPTERHTAKGWRVTGSLLGLDVALARLSLRRLDSTTMPPEPQMVSAERQTAALDRRAAEPVGADATRRATRSPRRSARGRAGSRRSTASADDIERRRATRA